MKQRRPEAWTSAETHVAGVVAAASRDADDCRELLLMLGLIEKPKRKRGRPRIERDHGDPRKYKQGCRCEKCQAANTAKYRTWRNEGRTEPARADRAGHGKASTYKNHGCRCDLCRAAHSEHMKIYMAARRRAKEETGP